MKIPFDIKYKPQIESGEYKVVTRDDRPARIICWDRFATKSHDNIIALVTKTTSESAYYYYQDGHLWDKANGEGDSQLDLFIITPEPELSEDERIRKWLYDYISNCPNDNFTFYGGVGKDAVLNYLERQKEQNKCPEFCSGHCGVGCPIYEKQKESKEISLMNGDADLYFDEWNQQNQNPTKRQCFEEGMKYAQRLQKEQKPVEIDEEINRWMGCEAFPEGVNITPLPQAMEIVERTAKHFSELGFELGEKTVPSPGGYCEGFNAGVRECQAKLRDVKGAMKEQKPVKRPKFKIGDVVKFKGFGDEPADDTPLKIVGYDNELYLFDNGTTDLFSEQNLYELVEQKAHRMERYQELVFKDICKHLEVEGYSGWVMFLNALRNGELQPKQEWSEEDEEMINSILFVLESYVSQSYYKEIDWLKSFRPQKLDASKLENFDPVDVLNRIKTEWPTAWEKAVEKQEWNEEDEMMLVSIISTLKPTNGAAQMKIDWLENRVKSLRPQPHWKPSEEQMAGLLVAVGDEKERGSDVAKTLRSLYEQLRKLM